MTVASSQIERYRAGNNNLLRLMNRDLLAVWGSLDLDNPRRSRDALLVAVPELTDIYGEQAALVAAEWYDEVRALERVPGNFQAQMASTFPAEFVQQRVKYGAGHLFTATPRLMLPFLQDAISEYVLQPGRDTIQKSSIEDPQATGWHRETRPSDSFSHGCGFCRMLAGRGGVYKRSSVSFSAHGNCHCVGVPSWDRNAPEVPAAVYEASKSTANMTNEQRTHHNEFIRSYVQEHYPES